MTVTNSIKYIGVKDLKLDLFEGQFPIPQGIRYNSYLIKDEKNAVMDSVGGEFENEWFEKIDKELEGSAPDYLVVLHMEPDHSANIANFAAKYPNAIIVSSLTAFNMMKNYFGTDYSDRRIVVKEGEELTLGKHCLKFIAAPLVHWPEVMMAYELSEKVLFSADAFGTFGVDETPDNWDDEARRYYIGIVGKFGANVQKVHAKAAGLEFNAICSLHGPVIKENFAHYISLYDTWSKYEPEDEGICICYTSVYGHTKEAMLYLKDKLENMDKKVEIFDLARDGQDRALASAYRYSKLVLATTTYNGGIFPYMHDFINHLIDHNFQKRKVALVENGTWGPMAKKKMEAMLSELKDLTFAENNVTIKGAVLEEEKPALDKLAAELA